MTEWKEFNIADIADIFNEMRVPLNKMERSERQGKYPYYGASGIIDYLDSYLFDGDYVLISEDGENLKSRQTPIAFKASGQFWVNNHAHILKGKRSFHNELLIYFFQNIDLNPFITGAVQPKLNKANLLSIPIFLPKEENEQKSIASILSSLDDKIDLLQRQNKTLEQLAETLFRQWFVEEAEVSWEDASLSEIAIHFKRTINPSKRPRETFNHYSLPAFDDGKEPQKEIGKAILSGKYQVVSNSILISKLNPRTPRIWGLFGNIDEKNAICSTEFQVVKPKDNRYYGFTYCFLKSYQVSQELTGAASGTSGSHQRVNPQDIFNLNFRKPPKKLIEQFGDITQPSFQKIKSNTTQIRTLTQLRDTLLPKLMSGEVRVK